jgi:hypothetical protein
MNELIATPPVIWQVDLFQIKKGTDSTYGRKEVWRILAVDFNEAVAAVRRLTTELDRIDGITRIGELTES